MNLLFKSLKAQLQWNLKAQCKSKNCKEWLLLHQWKLHSCRWPKWFCCSPVILNVLSTLVERHTCLYIWFLVETQAKVRQDLVSQSKGLWSYLFHSLMSTFWIKGQQKSFHDIPAWCRFRKKGNFNLEFFKKGCLYSTAHWKPLWLRINCICGS